MRTMYIFLVLSLVPALMADEPEPQLKFLGSVEGVRPHSHAAIAFSPDGKFLAVSEYGNDNTLVKLCDVDKRKVIAKLRGHGNPVTSAVFSRDGKTLVTAGDGEEIKLWDVATARERAALKVDPAWNFLALSPDGKTAAFAKDNHALVLLDTATGKEKKEKVSLKGYSFLPGPAALSPDGTLFALGSGRYGSEGLPGAGEVKLWDITTGRERANLKGHVKLKLPFDQLSYLHKAEGVPKRVLLKVVGLNGMEFESEEDIDEHITKALKKVLDKEQQEKYGAVLLRHIRTKFDGPEVVWSVAFSPDGKTLASASVLGTILLWDVKTGKRTLTLQKFNVMGREEDINGAYSVAFSPDGKTLAAGTLRGIMFWDVKTGEKLGGLNRPQGGVWSVSFSPDGKTIASAGTKGLVTRHNTREGDADPTLRLWQWVPSRKADR